MKYLDLEVINNLANKRKQLITVYNSILKTKAEYSTNVTIDGNILEFFMDEDELLEIIDASITTCNRTLKSLGGLI